MSTATLPEERVLIPAGDKIRALRDDRHWTLEEAIHQAKELDLPLTGSTLRNAERGKKGCQLSTLGWIMKLYQVTDLDTIVVHVPDKEEPPAKSKSTKRPARRT
jgi:hypothetical protein